jgi:hypothetical protein
MNAKQLNKIATLIDEHVEKLTTAEISGLKKEMATVSRSNCWWKEYWIAQYIKKIVK